MDESVIAPLAGVIGILVGALATGLLKAWSDRTERGNNWLKFKRGLASAFMQHISVHCREGATDEEDRRLIDHYYTLALAVSADEAAVALYQALPDHLQRRVLDPTDDLFRHLRAEVTPRRKQADRG